MTINAFSDYSGYESDIDVLGNLLEHLASCLQENNDDGGFEWGVSELELISFIKVIFKIYASKQKRNCYKYGEVVTSNIIDTLSVWSSPNLAEIFCGFLENYERAQKEYAYLGLKC